MHDQVFLFKISMSVLQFNLQWKNSTLYLCQTAGKTIVVVVKNVAADDGQVMQGEDIQEEKGIHFYILWAFCAYKEPT